MNSFWVKAVISFRNPNGESCGIPQEISPSINKIFMFMVDIDGSAKDALDAAKVRSEKMIQLGLLSDALGYKGIKDAKIQVMDYGKGEYDGKKECGVLGFAVSRVAEKIS